MYNKPLKFVTATKSVAFTRTRFARLLAGRYVKSSHQEWKNN